MAASASPFFVVFDTCTQRQYYADVHRVLALPAGTVISYDYKRYLWTSEAAAAHDMLVDDAKRLPVDAVLMYGEAHGYTRGAPDPQDMLRWGSAVFIPTRSAQVLSVSRSFGSDGSTEVLQFHLQLGGFLNPASEAIEDVVRALEAQGALPFGDPDTQHRWVALLPEQVQNRAAALRSDDPRRWSQVVDRFITAPTQFRDDVFWRLTGIRESRRLGRGNTGPGVAVTLRDRPANASGDPTNWFRDYPLKESSRYELTVQTHTPQGGYAQRYPDATIALDTDNDHRGILRLSANPLQLRPDATLSQAFSIGTDSILQGSDYAGITLATQRDGVTSPYGGSVCTITVAISKQYVQLVVGCILCLVAVAAVSYAGFADDADLRLRIAATVLAAITGAAGGWALTREFKMSAKGAE